MTATDGVEPPGTELVPDAAAGPVTREAERTVASAKSIPREYYEALIIALIFLNFAKIFVFQFFKIPTGSMIDNLLIGDHIVVNKYVYGADGERVFGRMLGFRSIERGDIIVFRFPSDPSTDFVKRVIGLPGDELTIRDKKVLINGKLLEEPYTVHADERIYPLRQALPEPYRSRDQYGPVRVPRGHYFVMGDNRDRSNDSRYWGTVPRHFVKGKAFLVYWSIRGAPLQNETNPRERAKQLWSLVRNFVQLTRWDRVFFVIDSRYHYRLEAESPAG